MHLLTLSWKHFRFRITWKKCRRVSLIIRAQYCPLHVANSLRTTFCGVWTKCLPEFRSYMHMPGIHPALRDSRAWLQSSHYTVATHCTCNATFQLGKVRYPVSRPGLEIWALCAACQLFCGIMSCSYALDSCLCLCTCPFFFLSSYCL